MRNPPFSKPKLLPFPARKEFRVQMLKCFGLLLLRPGWTLEVAGMVPPGMNVPIWCETWNMLEHVYDFYVLYNHPWWDCFEAFEGTVWIHTTQQYNIWNGYEYCMYSQLEQDCAFLSISYVIIGHWRSLMFCPRWNSLIGPSTVCHI